MAIFNKTFGKFAAGFGVVILLAVGFVAYGGAGKYLEERAAQKAIAAYEARLAADTYGGKTPEETLSLFIDAIKKGDVDLASKYFLFEKQEKILSDFKIGKENGSLNTYLDYLNGIDGGSGLGDGSYRFTIVKDGRAFMGIDMLFNKYSNIWKIESL